MIHTLIFLLGLHSFTAVHAKSPEGFKVLVTFGDRISILEAKKDSDKFKLLYSSSNGLKKESLLNAKNFEFLIQENQKIAVQESHKLSFCPRKYATFNYENGKPVYVCLDSPSKLGKDTRSFLQIAEVVIQ